MAKKESFHEKEDKKDSKEHESKESPKFERFEKKVGEKRAHSLKKKIRARKGKK